MGRMMDTLQAMDAFDDDCRCDECRAFAELEREYEPMPVALQMSLLDDNMAVQPVSPQLVTCHACGATVEDKALDAQRGDNGQLVWGYWYCAAHFAAGMQRLQAWLDAPDDADEGEDGGDA